MPGYRTLSSNVTGLAADSAREAESLRRDGEPQNAVVLLEEALAASERASPELPGWLCGRLAALYRTLNRYDDEVRLLERYRESQTSDEARSRYDARLSKARTIAERKRRSDSGALSSVRKVLGTPRRRASHTVSLAAMSTVQDRSAEHLDRLTTLFAEAPGSDLQLRIDEVARAYGLDARTAGVPIERLVEGLRAASAQAALPEADESDRRYSAALVSLLAAYFDERDR